MEQAFLDGVRVVMGDWTARYLQTDEGKANAVRIVDASCVGLSDVIREEMLALARLETEPVVAALAAKNGRGTKSSKRDLTA